MNKKRTYFPSFNLNSGFILNLLFSFCLALNLVNFYSLDLIVTGLFVFGLFFDLQTSLKQRLENFFFKPHVFNYLVLLFLAAGVIGYIISSPMGPDQKQDILGLRWIFGFYAFYFAGKKLAKTKEKLSLSVPLLLIPLALIIKNHWFESGRKFFNPLIRLQGYYENPNHFALTVILLWAFFLGQFAIKTHPTENYKWSHLQQRSLFFGGLLLSAVLLATYSRSAWMGAIFSFFIATFYVKDRKFRLSAIASVVTATLIFVFNIFELRDRLVYTFDVSSTSAQHLRFLVWKVSWSIFADHPFFGVGFSENARMFPAYYQKLGLSSDAIVGNAHNQYLEVLSGAGIFGFITYMGIFILGLRYFHKVFTHSTAPSIKRIALSGILVIVALLISSLTDTPFRLHECRNYLIVLLGYSFGYIYNADGANDLKA